ncbi:hypothetical protein A4D02_26280 [Niastella koreensis]|uniref:Uncharacterized protein n=2 Tax=Niastella koreensis TaxID=354356 RepID=G8TKS6_NIAKG|nr:hypothetical protein [Niastella koreensis]AEV99755.1 hypothetical protein Niako_3451 [Niastella koreensis GR20-10]OQP51622.1 hypothetical protein A4D02_26280 [Niastella koreensis]
MNKKVLKKAGLASLVIAIVTILSLIFIIKYRIKSVIREVVRSETNGVYKLNFSKISIDFFKGRVKLNAVDFKPVSSDLKDYRFTISHLYFSLASWNQLFFHRKLFVDSLQINDPVITIFQQPVQKSNNELGPFQEIFKSLRNISEIFKVHVLEINRGNMTIYRETNDAPLVISNINFRVENFGQQQKQNTHLRFADNVTLRVGKQQWQFPSGQIIKFENLFFLGNDQTFQVDSCAITTAPDSRGQRTSLFAEKFLFRTNEIATVFERNELNLDTLYCKSPVLSVAIPADKKDNDTVSELNESIHQLPGNINIKFINIENGQIHLTSSDGKRSYTGKKTNFKIYGLNIGRNPVPYIRAGKIDLNLHEISFATRDSLYLLTVNEFRFDSNNLVCTNAYLKPSPKAKGYLKGIDLPAFTLIDISLNDLLEKRLKALVAVIDNPQFFFGSRAARKKAVESGIPVNKFYNTLKSLAQLVDVHWLTIKDGALNYTPLGSSTPELSLNKIDMEINLVGMLNSASIQETRQSIHALRIGSINLAKDNISAGLNNFFIDGSREIGTLGSLAVQLPSGIKLNAANLYWEGFSWEDFIRDKSIYIDTLNIPTIGLNAQVLPGGSGEIRSGLLPVTINRLKIGHSVIRLKTINNTAINATINHISLQGLQAAGRFVSWQNLDARADSISFRDDRRQIAVQRLHYSALGESTIQNISYTDSACRIKSPEIRFQVHLFNSHPDELRIGKLDIPRAYINYRPVSNSLSVACRFALHADDGVIGKSNGGAIAFDNFFLETDSLSLVKPGPHGLLEISNGSGGVAGYPLAINLAGNNPHLKNIINSVHITGGRLFYSDSTTIASVGNITGNGKTGALAFRDVAVNPRITLETFIKTTVWQKDYLTFHCDSIGLHQVNYRALLDDTSLAIRSVYLQHPRVTTFRNKNTAFLHGIEKLMPTKLLAGMKAPVRIDSVQIKGAVVNVQEVSAITKRKSIVPLSNLNGTITNIVSRPGEQDSLVLDVSGRVLEYEIRTLRYAESYTDSLSGFTMQYGIAPMQLTHLTKLTNPLSAIAITEGRADTLYAKLTGNKYASVGQINFYYHGLKVRLLNKEDSLKRSVFLSLETLLANGLIRSNNQNPARMFFIRDREKFVFNYWVKTLFSGFVTSTGVKRNRKYQKMYNEAEGKYTLPPASGYSAPSHSP